MASNWRQNVEDIGLSPPGPLPPFLAAGENIVFCGVLNPPMVLSGQTYTHVLVSRVTPTLIRLQRIRIFAGEWLRDGNVVLNWRAPWWNFWPVDPDN